MRPGGRGGQAARRECRCQHRLRPRGAAGGGAKAAAQDGWRRGPGAGALGLGGASHGLVGAISERGLEFSVGFDVTEPVRQAVLASPTAAGWRRSPRSWRSGRQPRWPRSHHCSTSPPGLRDPGCWCAGRSRIRGPATTCSIPRAAPPSLDHQLHRSRYRLPGGPPPAPRSGGRPGQGGQGVRAPQLPLLPLSGQPGLAAAGATGQDLLAWARRLCLPTEFWEAAPKRLRYQVLHVAGRLARSGRRTTLRLDARWPWAREPATGFAKLRLLPLAT